MAFYLHFSHFLYHLISLFNGAIALKAILDELFTVSLDLQEKPRIIIFYQHTYMHFLPQDKQDGLPGAPEINEKRESGKSPCFLLQQCARAKRHRIV